MAECVKTKEAQSESGNNLECAVCLQTCVHPAELPCGHIFCFLCVKGIANQSKRCAMCRQEIPTNFLEQPKLLEAPDNKDTGEEFDGGYQWFYEGRNGWWQYDERTSKELELAYKAGERTCELLIAGFLYIADFDSMIQRRRNDPARRRRIKRDLATIPKKGIAGLKFSGNESTSIHQEQAESPISSSHNNCPTPPVTPSEIPHTPVEAHVSEEARIESLETTMRSLSLLSQNDNNEDTDHSRYVDRRRNYYYN